MTKQRFSSVLSICFLLLVSSFSPLGAQDRPSTTVRVNDIEMHYQIVGSGEPLLLLHGFGGCGHDWQPFTQALAKQFQVIIPDLRGHGWSTNPAKTFTHRQSATDVLSLLDHLTLKRVRAMGISTGGMTLLHMATRQPEQIDAMVLIGATSYFPPQARRIMAASAERTPPQVREMQKRCAKRGSDQANELSAQFTAFKDSYDDMNFTAPYLSTIKARTLIVHGDRDIFFPVSIPVEMYQAIGSSELWIVPGGDHVPIYGPRLEGFLKVATEFLQRKESR
jgi:pimeloyl-ACP methyl ester carboxylesterase